VTEENAPTGAGAILNDTAAETVNSTCLRCGRSGELLNVAHWISVHDGKAEGLSETELFDDENLLVLCAECNAGQNRETLPLRFMATVLRVRIARERRNAS
jgi:hypothetical protein